MAGITISLSLTDTLITIRSKQIHVQLFAFHKNTALCAQWLCDKHVVKIPTEAVQILNTALHVNGCDDTFYKPTHTQHPIVQWTADSLMNWRWARLYAYAVGGEYTNRYDKSHTSIQKLRDWRYGTAAPYEYFDDVQFTPPPRAFDYESDADSVWLAYRDYYRDYKIEAMDVRYDRGRQAPEWLFED